MSMILMISGMVLVVSVILFIYSNANNSETAFGLGLLGTVASIFIGFVVLGFGVAVDKETIKPGEIEKSTTSTSVMYVVDGETYTSENVSLYKSDPKDIRVVEEYNSYGCLIEDKLKMVNDGPLENTKED